MTQEVSRERQNKWNYAKKIFNHGGYRKNIYLIDVTEWNNTQMSKNY